MAEKVAKAQYPIFEALALLNKLSGEKISSLEEKISSLENEKENLQEENAKLQGLVEEIQNQADFIKKKNSELKEQLSKKTAAAVASATKEPKKAAKAPVQSSAVIQMTEVEIAAHKHCDRNASLTSPKLSKMLSEHEKVIEDFGGLKKALVLLIDGKGINNWITYSNGVSQRAQLQFLLGDNTPICYYNTNEDLRIITVNDAKFLLEVIKVVERRRDILARASAGRY